MPQYNSEKPHGLMFHHFHGASYPRSQGSISGEQFEMILDHVATSCQILSANDWMESFNRGNLSKNDVCITFDDALKCQYDIAAPILRKKGLTAFFFVYSGVLEGHPEKLEVYRHVRNTCFENLDAFYDEFEERVLSSNFVDKAEDAIKTFNPDHHYTLYSFYSDRDKRYRYLRDSVLSKAEHDFIMDEIVKTHVPDTESLRNLLWMTENDVKTLHLEGHIIGLHSYSHPTNLARLEEVEQFGEYRKNKSHLEALIGAPVMTMSHPCNSYDDRTLKILRTMGLAMGFRDNMGEGAYGELEAPRIDHMDVWRQIS